MEYSVFAGGKRLRPMLMEASYQMFDGTNPAIDDFMAAIEMEAEADAEAQSAQN